jgi:Flp pilus assembly pilin Flp
MSWRSRGQGFLEYALIILFVVLVVIVTLVLIGPTLANVFSRVPPSL